MKAHKDFEDIELLRTVVAKDGYRLSITETLRLLNQFQRTREIMLKNVHGDDLDGTFMPTVYERDLRG